MADRLGLLGSGALASGLPADRRGCLLAYLAVEGGWVRRDRLALLFWPDVDTATARRNLRQLVLRTRRLPLDPPLEATADALRWPVETDVAAFRRAVAGGDPEAAVAAYGGTLLDGLLVRDVGGFDAWLEGEQDRLRRAFLDVGVERANELLATGMYGRAVDLLARVHEADPLAEDALAAYVRALYLAGRRDAALAAYARFERQLADELSLAPLNETTELAEAVRRGAALELSQPRAARAERVALTPTRLAGRDSARRALLTASTPVVLLCGEPGIGKSALLTEAAPGGLGARAVEGLERVPYHPLVRAVREHAAAAASLGRYRQDLARLVPEVGGSAHLEPLAGDEAKVRVAEALVRLVEALGGQLVLDDLQWADPATLEVFVYAATRGKRVYGAFRTGEVGTELARVLRALREQGLLTVVEVEPLDEESVRAVIADLMGAEEGPQAFARRLWRHTGGNPLFLLETLRALFESGRLSSDESGWRTEVDDVALDPGLVLPPRVADVIARRVERLGAGSLRVLEALALARAPLTTTAAAEVAGLSPAAAADALDEAEAAGFLAGGAFRHDLLRQAVDARVAPARRRLLEARLAQALEGAADRGVVAEHWLAAGETARARAAWQAQAAELRRRGLHPAATAMLASAVGRLPPGRDAAWLHLALADVHREAGRVAEAEASLASVATLPEAPADLTARRLVCSALLAMQAGRFSHAAELFAEASRLRPLLPDDETLDRDLEVLAVWLAREQGRHEEALELLEHAVARLRRSPPSLGLVQHLSNQGVVLDDLGRHEEALRLHREAHELATALSVRYQQVETAINLLFCLGELRLFEEAVAVAGSVLDLGEFDGVAVVRVNVGYCLRELGRLEEAAAQYDAAATTGLPHVRAIALSRAALCLQDLGRPAEAVTRVDAAIQALADVEAAQAVGSVTHAALVCGDARQLRRLASMTAGLDPARVPGSVLEQVRDALTRRGEAARLPGAWWSTLPEGRVTPA